MISKQELIDFEKDIEQIYQTSVIRGPIHLRDGNEDHLISIFKYYHRKGDYVFSTWANHLHALLAGIPKEKVKARILEGQSMAMNFPEYNFYTSAIVAGILPIAVGVASTIEQKSGHDRVLCFIGDMAVRTGIAHESIIYAANNQLPILFVVEDNGKSVGTITDDVCPNSIVDLVDFYSDLGADITYYKYDLKYPHSGTGSFVSF